MTVETIGLECVAVVLGALGRHVAPATATTVRKVTRRRPKTHRILKPKPAPQYVRVYDGVTITALGRVMSTSTDLVAAYDDGWYDNVAAARKDYPHHKVLTIAIHPTDPGDFLDVEPGCCWPPAKAKGWLEARRAAGARFIGIYADADNWRQLVEVPGIDLRGVVKWIADQNGVPHIPPGYDGCQYDGSAVDPKLKYDVSLFRASALKEL